MLRVAKLGARLKIGALLTHSKKGPDRPYFLRASSRFVGRDHFAGRKKRRERFFFSFGQIPAMFPILFVESHQLTVHGAVGVDQKSWGPGPSRKRWGPNHFRPSIRIGKLSLLRRRIYLRTSASAGDSPSKVLYRRLAFGRRSRKGKVNWHRAREF